MQRPSSKPSRVQKKTEEKNNPKQTATKQNKTASSYSYSTAACTAQGLKWAPNTMPSNLSSPLLTVLLTVHSVSPLKDPCFPKVHNFPVTTPAKNPTLR